MAIKAIYRPADELMANAVRDLFEENGIPAMIRSFQIPAYDGLARTMRPVWGEVLVDEEDMARAKELIEAFLAADASSSTSHGLSGWRLVLAIWLVVPVIIVGILGILELVQNLLQRR